MENVSKGKSDFAKALRDFSNSRPRNMQASKRIDIPKVDLHWKQFRYTAREGMQ